jgi:uncharacterized membrane protein
MLEVLALLQDLATIGCGTFNAAYFAARWARTKSRPSHRVGVAALTLVNAAVVLESLFFLALYWTYQWHRSLDLFLSPLAWLSARSLLLAGTAFISLLIVRQRRR